MRAKLVQVQWTLLAASLLVVGCGSRVQESYGSESHFLTACDETCGGGLSCIDHRCTRVCEDQRDCNGLSSDAVCLGSGETGPNQAAGAVCDRESAAPCEEGGLHYAIGDRWRCSDGCNSCFCTEEGVESTLIGCPAVTCEDNGIVYQLGDQWTCSDGCNTCTCVQEGIQTTDMACPRTCEYVGETYDVGDRWTCSDGCNTCVCGEDGSVSSTDIACSTETCSSNGLEYQVGETMDFGDGATCVCLSTGLIGSCTGVPDEGGTTAEPTDGGPTPDPDERARCYLPPDSGDCDAAIPAIYFDAQSGQCLQFIWGGCGGNANRFDSNGECYEACGRDAN